MKSERALALLFVAGLVLAACDRNEGPGEVKEEASTDAPATHPLAWRGTFTRASGVGALEVLTASGWEALEPGAEVAPGATLRTSDRSIALVTLRGEGALILNKSTTLHLTPGAPGARVERGHAIVETPQSEEAQGGDKPQLGTPTGSVTLTGTTVSVLADAAESVVTVAQGEARASAAPTSTEALIARFGQELVLPSEGAPRVVGSPDLPQTFGWGEVPDGESELPSVERGMGKLMAKSPRGGGERPLELREHHIDVKIQGAMAYTEITEVFHNPTGDELEGTYRFPLPPGAQISRMALEVDGRMMEGQFLETARAERIWRDIIDQWRDPALLKWKQGDQFELRIFPIMPRTSRKVVIGYVERLEESARGYRYAYPLPIDRSGQTKTGELTFTATVSGHPAEEPVRALGYAGIEVRQRDGLADAATTDVSFAKKDFSPSGDIGLEFAVHAEQRELRAWGYEDPKRAKEDGWVALAVRPEFAPSVEPGGRDFVVVLDSSYGRRGVTMKLQAGALGALVDALSPLDRVRVLSCATRCEALGSLDFEHARGPLARALAQAAGGLEAAGSTYTVEAVRAASSIFAKRSEKERARSAHVVYMTDGVASAGALDPAPILEATRALLEPSKAKLTVVDLGGGSDEATLGALARGGGGQVVALRPGDTMRASALRILRHHYGASLRDLAITLPPELEQVYPTELEGTLAGDELLVVARAKRGATIDGEVTLTGTVAGAKWSAAYPLSLKMASEPGDAFVPRLWGTHRIAELERTAGDHQREIVSLSKKYGVLTRYTTLLALESREMEEEFGVRRQRHIDWKGEEAPTDGDDEGEGLIGDLEDDAEAPDPRKRATRRRPSAPKMKKAKPKRDSLADDLFNDGATSAAAPSPDAAPVARGNDTKDAREGPRKPVAREEEKDAEAPRLSKSKGSAYGGKRRYRPYCYNVPVSTIGSPEGEVSAQTRRIDRYAEKLEKDPTNRSNHMRHVRALMAAGEGRRDEARQAAEVWLEMNPMDPEAVAQRAQIALNDGEVDVAMRWLEGAVDAAARAEWIQKRVMLAHTALGDEALACAHRVALEQIDPPRRRKGAPTDVLACPMASRPSDLFSDASPSTEAFSAPPSRAKGRSGLVVDVQWAGEGDVDVVLVEPSGRLLSFLSQRQGLEVGGVRGGAAERLRLKRLRKGTYQVRLVRRAGSAPIDAKVTLAVDGERRRYEVTVGEQPVEFAEVTRGTRRRCR